MLLDYVKVFFVGGIICLIAQIMMDYFKMQTPYVMVTYVTSGVILTFLGIYEPIVNFGSSGATVPIIGFGYLLANGVKTAILQHGSTVTVDVLDKEGYNVIEIDTSEFMKSGGSVFCMKMMY